MEKLSNRLFPNASSGKILFLIFSDKNNLSLNVIPNHTSHTKRQVAKSRLLLECLPQSCTMEKFRFYTFRN